jgi:hypothetical protein
MVPLSAEVEMNDTAWYLGVREKRAFDWPWQQEEASPEVPYAGLGALLGGGGLFFGSGPLTKKPLRELSTAEMRLRSAVDSLQQDIEYNKPWEAQHLRWGQEALDQPLSEFDSVNRLRQTNIDTHTAQAAKHRQIVEEAMGALPAAVKAHRASKLRRSLVEYPAKALPWLGLGLAGYGAYDVLSGRE